MTPPDPPRSPAPAESSSADERELIQRCLAGDTAAFEPLVERYRQRVWRLAYQMLRDREEAWDCAQEAFVRAFHSLSSFRGQSAFYTWLFRITVNVATDRQRSRGAQARAFGAERVPEEEWKRTIPDVASQPDQSAMQSEQRERIRRALNALPPKARTIIMLSDVEGLSYREIADVLGCPIGTVMSRLHNARKRMKVLLRPMVALLIWVSLGLAAGAVDAEPMIHFGVRVIQASNTPVTDTTPPAPTRSLTPNPPPSASGPVASEVAPSGTAAPIPPTPDDERFRRLLPKLRTIFRYNDYVTLERHRVDGPIGMLQRFSLPGDRWLEVTPNEMMEGRRVRMLLRLLKGEKPEMHTSIITAPGAPAVLGGPPHGNGVLIIILWANPNPPKPR